MKQSPSYRPIHRLRVFTACLLSLLMLMAPMAPLAASVNSAAAARAEQRALANGVKKQLTAHEVPVRSSFVNPPALGVPPPNITATLADSFIDTSPADSRADPGSIVTYTAVIKNTGGPATGVNFSDTISPYTTLIGGSIKSSPRATVDSYNATQDTVLDTAASSLPTVVANDAGTPAPTVSGIVGCADVTAPFTCNTTQVGGSVTLNTDGSFTYTPPTGFTGADDFTYTATNGLAPDDTAKVTLNVGCGSLTVTNPATTSGPAGTPFSQTFTQSGGAGAVTFTLNSGTLPTGLTLHSATGILDGTPTQGGTFPITVKATDSNSCTGIGPTYNLTITCPTITVTNPATNSGTVGTAFTQTFTQSGGQGTITWSKSGTLPTGITLNTSSGVLSGTPTQSGSFPITVTATDSNGCTGTGATYTLTISCQTITVTKPVTATGTVDAAFSQNFTQTGAQGTATFTTASTLPAGLSLATTGTLSGTPTQTGSFPIVVTVTDSNSCTGNSSTYTLVIGCQTITVTKPATTTGTVSTPFSQNFTQTGAHGTATFTTASTLPAGLSLATSGTLSGTPTQTGSFPIVVTVTDSNSCTGSSATYTLVIGCQSITVTNPATNTGTAGTAFSQTFTQSNGIGTITWSETGALPAGITLNSSSGVLSGTTSQTGSFPITVKATDSNGCFGTGATYTLTIGCQGITVTNPGVNSGTAGTAFSQQFTVSGILGTATWSETGALPSGITLNSSTGVLSGTTNQVGSFPITVKALDTNGCFGTSSYTLTIACQSITVTNPGVNSGTVDARLQSDVHAERHPRHGDLEQDRRAAGRHHTQQFCEWRSLRYAGQPGSFPITVKVTDTNGCFGTSSYTLTIACQTITVTNPGVSNGTVDTAFSQTFTQSGVGTHTPATFTTASDLAGLSLSTAGVLSGTPNKPGSFPIVVTVTDANGCTGTNSSYTLVIACQTITVTNPGVALATYNTAFSQTFTGTGLSHTPLNLDPRQRFAAGGHHAQLEHRRHLGHADGDGHVPDHAQGH